MNTFAIRVIASFAACALALPATAQSCLGDVAVDSRIDGGDLGVLLANWGPVTSTALSRACDFDSNGQIDGADLGALLANWGACPIRVPSWATLIELAPDPTIITDPALRTAISASGWAWRVCDTATQVEMLLVPPGTFQMGCVIGTEQYGCFAWELPVHQVSLTHAFYLGRFEVTQRQWEATMGNNPSTYRLATAQVPISEVPNRPVETVSWNSVQGYLTATGFRLPTEAEWERACRAGTDTPFYNGSTVDATLGDLAWCYQNQSGQTHPVGKKSANSLGFHDMLGNVYEWANDWLANYTSQAQTDPVGPPSGQYRILRGGHFALDSNDTRSMSRGGSTPNEPISAGGFRVARNP
jgi:formylglycine-generating enzyme required for sulfatase activity